MSETRSIVIDICDFNIEHGRSRMASTVLDTDHDCVAVGGLSIKPISGGQTPSI